MNKLTAVEQGLFFEKLNNFDDIYYEEDENELTIQALEEDADEVREVLDRFGLDYEESDFWESDMCGTNFYVEL